MTDLAPSRRPVARVFTPAPLDADFPNGFSGRWLHFTRALGAQFDLEVVGVAGVWHESPAPDTFRPRLPLARFELLHARRLPGWLPAPLRSLAQLLASFNTRRWGPRITGADRALAPPPDLAVFCAHHIAHLAFRLPPATRCLFVLEEGLVRSLFAGAPHAGLLKGPRRAWRTLLHRLALRRYRLFTARCAQRGPVIVISDDERRWYLEWMQAEQVTTIPLGLDPAEYAPGSTDPDHDVAVFGDLSHVRNYVPVLELFERAQQRADARSLRWLLVGRDPASALRALPAERVTLTGTVDDTRPWYPRARVVVVPARVVTGSKTTLLKAWAMQRPVVVTPFGTPGQPARDGENVLVADSADAILDAVLSLLRDPARAAAIAAAGREALLRERNQVTQAAEFAELAWRCAAPADKR